MTGFQTPANQLTNYLSPSGLKLDLVVSHVLLGVAIVTMVVTESLWVYYVTSVLMGFQRVAFYTVPTIVAKDYVQSKVSSTLPFALEHTTV